MPIGGALVVVGGHGWLVVLGDFQLFGSQSTVMAHTRFSLYGLQAPSL